MSSSPSRVAPNSCLLRNFYAHTEHSISLLFEQRCTEVRSRLLKDVADENFEGIIFIIVDSK